jgi:hypothetical protein
MGPRRFCAGRAFITGSYRIMSTRTREGNAYRLMVTVVNRSPRPFIGTPSGSIWVSGLVPRQRPRGVGARSEYDPQRKAWRLRWGGSSSDTMGVGPHGSNTNRVEIGEWVLTAPNGKLLEVHPVLDLATDRPGSAGSWCPVPLRRVG